MGGLLFTNRCQFSVASISIVIEIMALIEYEALFDDNGLFIVFP